MRYRDHDTIQVAGLKVEILRVTNGCNPHKYCAHIFKNDRLWFEVKGGVSVKNLIKKVEKELAELGQVA